MKKIVAIGGVPASGKTTLMRGIMSLYQWQAYSYGMIKGHWNPDRRLLILGVYDEQTFAGTDRLSMAVISDAKRLLGPFPGYESITMVFEGDRLFNSSYLNSCKAHTETKIFCLSASEGEQHRRHVLRGDTQNETWLKGRKTKIDNILEQFPETVILPNHNENNYTTNLKTVLAELSA